MIAAHGISPHDALARGIDRDHLVFRLHRDHDAVRGRIVVGVAGLAADRDEADPRVRLRIDDEIRISVLVRHEHPLLGGRVRNAIGESGAGDRRDGREGAINTRADLLAFANSTTRRTAPTSTSAFTGSRWLATMCSSSGIRAIPRIRWRASDSPTAAYSPIRLQQRLP